MKAVVFDGHRLELKDEETPRPAEGEVLIAVEACGVCRTDLHVVDGELSKPKLPLIPGHQVVGRIIESRSALAVGRRVGVAWLASTCCSCKFCLDGRENLCRQALFTGYTRDGGYADMLVASADYVYELSDDIDPISFSPLMCGGLIGWRAYKFARESLPAGGRLGIYGFGSAAHIIAQIARADNFRVSAFVRHGDQEAADFALEQGVDWAGFSDELPPQLLDAAIVFAPAGELVPAALRATERGAAVILGGIHMSAIPSFPYEILWGERSLKSVANLTRMDGREFFGLLSGGRIKISTQVETRPLAEAEGALADLRAGKVKGSLSLKP